MFYIKIPKLLTCFATYLKTAIPLSIFLFSNNSLLFAQCNPQQDSLVLVELYDSTNGDKWINTLTGDKIWKIKNTAIKDWYGIRTNNAGCVTQIFLSSDSLRGTLPASLSTLSDLNWLHLSENNISGQLPNFNQANLDRLWLFKNKLTGSIPNFKAPKLRDIWLSNNQLNGTIPNFDLPLLENLELSQNELTGNIPNLKLPALQDLSLYANNLEGSIPNFNLPALQDLSLYGNNLEGSIPYFNLPNLKSMVLSDNQLGDTIPDFDLPQLETMWLYNNKLTGQIPFFNLPRLKNLWLSDNQLSGFIPNFNLTNLEDLSLSKNQLSNSIPNFNLPNLKRLSLSSNKLSGSIPFEIKINCPLITILGSSISGNPSLSTQSWANYWNNREGTCPPIDTTSCRYRDSIQLVNFYNKTGGSKWENKWILTQPLKNWFGVTLNTEGCVIALDLPDNNIIGVLPNLNLQNLINLNLEKNLLVGTIPNFSSLFNLRKMRLNFNQLTGNIPNFNLKNLEQLLLSNNKLNGLIPQFLLPNLQDLWLSNNQITGTLPNFNLPKLLQVSFGGNKINGQLPELDSVPNLNYIQLQNNQLSGCFPLGYIRFCSIPNPANRNFSGNSGLPNNGNFDAFCALKPKLDSFLLKNDTLQRGENIKIFNKNIVKPTVTTTYRDTITKGCSGAYYILTIVVESKSNIKTAITPNGDGYNDKLDFSQFTDIDWQLYPQSSLEIFNRWGQELYRQEPYLQGWAGENKNGNDLPEGDYFFVLKLKPSGEVLKGVVHLFR